MCGRGDWGVLSQLEIPFCIASSGTVARIERSLTKVGLRDTFGNRIFSADHVEQGKPAPDLFFYAAAEMRVPPSNCAVVEDSPNGVTAGVAAGMTVFGYTALTSSSKLAHAHLRFDSMDDLLPLLRS